MKKILCIIPPHDFRDEEFNIPLSIFESASYLVDVASTATGDVVGVKGSIVRPDKLLGDLSHEDYDAFVVVGGSGTKKYLWENTTLHKLLKKAYMNNRLISGICAGSVVLARAGLLKNIPSTTFQSEDYIDELKKAGAQNTGSELEVHGNLITASGPDAAHKFARAICQRLEMTSNHKTMVMPEKNPFFDL